MQLLDEIIASASGNSDQLSGTLRKCLVLAFKLKNDSLKAWVQRELNGYAADDELPSYRKSAGTAKGLFLGPMGATINNQPLPPAVLDEGHRTWARDIELRQPIASYEVIKPDARLSIDWPADLLVRYQSKFIEGYALNRAWLELPTSVILGLIDTVRTRALTLALQIQDELPAGASEEGAIQKLLPDKVQSIINVTVMGGTNVIGDVQDLKSISITPNDFHALREQLTKLGISHQEIDELKADMDADSALIPRGETPKSLGKATTAWIAKSAASLGKAGLKITATVAEEALRKAVFGYLGLSS